MKEDLMIGVLASDGDAQMGADMLTARGIKTKKYSVVVTAREQTQFQMQPLEVRTERIRGLLKEAIADGMDSVMVYCNSLSSTIDFPSLSKELGVKIVTPLMAYGDYAKKHNTLAVMAGNSQGLAGIERAIIEANMDATVIGAGTVLFPIEVEAKTPPKEIIEKFGLEDLLKFFAACEAEVIIMGCTHFPYFMNELQKKTDIELLNPDDRMVEILLEQ